MLELGILGMEFVEQELFIKWGEVKKWLVVENYAGSSYIRKLTEIQIITY